MQTKADKDNELEADKKKRIVQTYLQKLIKTDPNLYYAPTAVISIKANFGHKKTSLSLPFTTNANARERGDKLVLNFDDIRACGTFAN